MSRSRCNVSHLAEEAATSPTAVIESLCEAGIRPDAKGSIPRSKSTAARRILGLPTTRQLRTVGSLSREVGLPVEVAAQALLKANLLNSSGKLSVSRGRLREARRVLVAVVGPSGLDPVLEANTLTDVRVANVPSAQQGVPRSAPLPAKARVHSSKQPEYKWPTIGKRESLLYLTPDDINSIHWSLVRDFAKSRDPVDPPGVRDPELLHSASFRPFTALGGELKYPTVAMAGAALFHSLVHDHPFHNGNKRTALVALLAFLDVNGYVLMVEEDQLYDYVLSLAAHEIVFDDEPEATLSRADLEVLGAARWIQRHMKAIQKGEFPIKFRELRAVLGSYGCEFEKVPGNRINIYRGEVKMQIDYTDDGTEVPTNTMHAVRKTLHLDEEHGCDSDIFYTAGPHVDGFINKYRKTLERLAKI